MQNLSFSLFYSYTAKTLASSLAFEKINKKKAIPGLDSGVQRYRAEADGNLAYVVRFKSERVL